MGYDPSAASAAEGVLASILVGTYIAYYFERENRRYIQIDDVFGSVDSVNYISFAINSHGGQIYFGFVDQVVYINDQLSRTVDDININKDDFIRIAKERYDD